MSGLSLTGDLKGLEILTLDHLNRFKAAVERGQQQGFAYYFPYLLAKQRPERDVLLLGEDQGSLCVFILRQSGGKSQLELAVAPTPLDPQVLARCLERANDFNGNRSARLLRLDEKDVPVASEVTGLRLKERKSQYLYEPQAFADLSGGRFRTLRRNVTRIQQLSNLEVRPYSAQDEDGCRALLRQWKQNYHDPNLKGGGVKSSAQAIELAGKLSAPDLHGEVLLLEGKLVGFAFGGEIRPGMGCFLEAKCDMSIAGLSYYQRYSFLSKLTSFELVNDGSDAGRPGLQQLKQSLRPAAMQVEYRGTQRPKRVVSFSGALSSGALSSGHAGTGALWTDNEPERRVGLLCNLKRRGDPLEQLSPSLLNRAILLGEDLGRSGIELFLFSPRYVQENGEVAGYQLRGHEVAPVVGRIPRVNANWTYGTRKLINRGMGYERFKRWTRDRGIQVYVPYQLSELVANKCDTYELIRAYDATLHPRTEDLDGTAEQIEAFVHRAGLAFIKPRAGNKGNRIFVLRQSGEDYSLKHYHEGMCRLLEPISVAAAMAIIEIAATQSPYIIQEGVESLRFGESVFDVRAVMVNDGRQWHSMLETRLAPPGSDLSNIFQGGSIRVTEELLESELGPAAGQALARKIKQVSHGVAAHLESRFPGRVMELGLDLVIDRDQGIHLVEVNAKPGLSGWASERRIFDWQPEDEAYYAKTVRPHVRHLASFLQSTVERSAGMTEVICPQFGKPLALPTEVGALI